MRSDVVATLDVAALRHNLSIVHEQAPKSHIMAVVKADAYGHGLQYLWSYIAKQVDGMAVARVSEAIELRQWGYRGTILVLSGFDDTDDLSAIDEYQLQTVIHRLDQIELLQKANLFNPITVWLKLETGMHRLGIAATEVATAYQRLQAHNKVKQVILMTHFASSEWRDSDVTVKQIQLFQEITKSYPVEKSLSNSAGILAWPEAQQQWIRPGLMMYGGSPFSPMEQKPLLKAVMRLTAPIKAIHTIHRGDAVGYNSTFVAKETMHIAVVGVGYGDGYPRSLPTGSPVWLNGKIASVVGRVSMDSVMIDVTAQSNRAIGDEVVLWGPELPIEIVADYAKRDPREVLCGVSVHRIERKIVGEDK